jgi:twitching motility two-component system response regulator PilG
MEKNLLLVDDSVAIREVVGLTFEETDVVVRTAAALEEAWGMVQEDNPDVIVADADKAQIGGWELCRRIKEDPNFRSIPIVLFTWEDPEGPHPSDLAPDALLNKPFGSDDLGKTVGALIGLDAWNGEQESEPTEDVPLEAEESEILMEEDVPIAPEETEAEPPVTPLAEEVTEPPALNENGQDLKAQPSPDSIPPIEDLRPIVESTIREAVRESLNGLNEEELRPLIASAVRDALADLAPQITGLVEQVAREIVPELAEIWIEREILRLKEEG